MCPHEKGASGGARWDQERPRLLALGPVLRSLLPASSRDQGRPLPVQGCGAWSPPWPPSFPVFPLLGPEDLGGMEAGRGDRSAGPRRLLGKCLGSQGAGVSGVTGQQLSLRPLRGPWAWAAAGSQLSGGLWAGGAWSLRKRVDLGGTLELAMGPDGSKGRPAPGPMGSWFQDSPRESRDNIK